MTQNTPITGGCQCGAVRYRASGLEDDAHLCHCRMCQKAVGNYFAAIVSAPRAGLTWTRGEPSRFRSSAHVDRGFCAKCGTPLFYEDVASGGVGLMIGTLDDPAAIRLKSQDGIEGRMAWFPSLPGVEERRATEVELPERSAAIRASNRQWRDGA